VSLQVGEVHSPYSPPTLKPPAYNPPKAPAPAAYSAAAPARPRLALAELYASPSTPPTTTPNAPVTPLHTRKH
jgi:hypothetical protein